MYFAGKIFFMLPSQGETQATIDNRSGDFTTSNSIRNKLQASTHAGTWSGFPQRAAATPGTCSTSMQKKYLSETPLVPKSLPLQHQMEVICEPLEGYNPLLPLNLGFCQHPFSHGARETQLMLLPMAWQSCLLLSSLCFERLTPFRINQPWMLWIVLLVPERASWS